MSKRLNTDILRFGDIILAGYPSDRDSQMICRFTHSKYSHAMLYWESSILHSTSAIVTTQNPSREIYEDNDSVCILRLKNEYFDQEALEKAVLFARSKVGTLYDREALKRIVRGSSDPIDDNREFCSKYVAEAFEYGGISLVDNVKTCSPQDIFTSPKLSIVDSPLLDADDDYVAWATADNVLDDQNTATIFLLYYVREYTGQDIVTIEQIFQHLLAHPGDDEKISEILINSGYLTLWEKEELYSPENYNMDLFEEKYKELAPYQAQKAIDDGFRITRDSKMMIYYCEQCEKQVGKLRFFELMINLHKNIINQCERRNSALSLLTWGL